MNVADTVWLVACSLLALGAFLYAWYLDRQLSALHDAHAALWDTLLKIAKMLDDEGQL